MEKVVQYLVDATEKIASSYCLQNTTTPEEINDCKGLLERSIAEHPELLSVKPEDLHRDHLSRYEDFTANMTVEQKNVFTIELYNTIVEASLGAMRLLVQVNTSESPVEPPSNDDNERVTITRDDVIAKYIGSTEKNVVDILEANRGKNFFIKESDICHDDKDFFGKQALAQLKLWFQENPEEKLWCAE